MRRFLSSLRAKLGIDSELRRYSEKKRFQGGESQENDEKWTNVFRVIPQ